MGHQESFADRARGADAGGHAARLGAGLPDLAIAYVKVIEQYVEMVAKAVVCGRLSRPRPGAQSSPSHFYDSLTLVGCLQCHYSPIRQSRPIRVTGERQTGEFRAGAV